MLNLNLWNSQKGRLVFKEKEHEYYWDGTKIPYTASGIISPMSPYTNGDIPPEVLAAACVRGTMVHKWIEEDINGVALHQREMLEAYKPFIKAYLTWKDLYSSRFDFLVSEIALYSREHKFPGTIDAIMYDKIDDEIVLLDFKTSAKENNILTQAQLAGYKLLVEDWDIAEIKKTYVLYLKKDGTFNFRYSDMAIGHKDFTDCLKIKQKEIENEKNFKK